MGVTRGEGGLGEDEEDKRSQIYDDGKRRIWVVNTQWTIQMLYYKEYWSLCNVTTQCYANKFDYNQKLKSKLNLNSKDQIKFKVNRRKITFNQL